VASKRPKSGDWGVTLVWRENELDRWAAGQRAKAATINRLVG
jgi:hypothetical protein